ncbi:MAG TPA: hydrogenase nickel incorporation protein HypB [Candidatus Acidoferrales bacterium]|nr:hydrogenase nickel incorporation protein HypB [Candidatus Acidoferrales bacterium]
MSRIEIERKVLNENDRIAADLRERFLSQGTLCVNLISAPGSGKTALLERTLESFGASERIAVLTGDIQTDNDAARLQRYGFRVRQITTGGTCHLDARMIARALEDARWDAPEILFIENVGNLVCPASYDLGEAAKIVLLSVTEGEDKPLKYPAIFFKSALAILTKTDLLPHLKFDIEQAEENARRVHSGIELIRYSATTNAGMEQWRAWLDGRREQVLKESEALQVSWAT